eukprot:GFUD01025397.1.p1 GENE.GFUD01025397.1~~GFUD01025397.1.p1  ORF type:complete len:448 (+),score=116.84 GFUD01025397.1:56-1399(+)
MTAILLMMLLSCVSSRHFNCRSICMKHSEVDNTTQEPSHDEKKNVQAGNVNCYGNMCVVSAHSYNKFEVPKPWAKPVIGSKHKYKDKCKDTVSSSVLEVGTEFNIMGVRGIDLDHGFIEVEMYVAMKWSDPELGVCVCKGGHDEEGTYEVGSNLVDEIWVPDMIVWHYKEFNRVDGLVRLNELQVKAHGHCATELRYAFDCQVKLRCDMNVDWYPFDQNICHVKLGSHSHTSDEVIFSQGEETAQHSFSHTSYKDYKFKVLPLCEHATEESTVEFSGDIATFRVTGFSLVIARKAGRILLEYTIVLSILVIVAIFSSCLPLESGRAGVVVGTALCVIFVLVVLGEYTPHGEGGTNMVLLYSLWCLAFIFLSYLNYSIIMVIQRWPYLLPFKITEKAVLWMDRSFFMVSFCSFIVFNYIFWMNYPGQPPASSCHNEETETELDCSVPN